MALTEQPITIIGGGLAGSEAAWQCAVRGLRVDLYEMRPTRPTAIHRSDALAEIVCSNSFKSLELSSAHGLLKAEMSEIGSLILACAAEARVPAGTALAVDRELFSELVTRRLERHPLVKLHREEVRRIPPAGLVVVAAGPLCSEALTQDIASFTGEDNLAFYDAISPIIEDESIDPTVVFRASRHGKGGGRDYLNCPMKRDEYESFIDALLGAELAEMHDFDRALLFEGCLPIEEMAARGRETLRFGPMRPIGLTDPRDGQRPWAVVQLRQDDLAASHWSLVGFQNRLKWSEQKRVFRMIPGLDRAKFIKLGMMHRNTYLNAPRMLRETFQARSREELFFAGQISGVEGYTESTASGLVAGLGAAALARSLAPPVFPRETALGSLQHYVAHAAAESYQPTNISFGLLPPLEGVRLPKRERKRAISLRAIGAIRAYVLGCPLFAGTQESPDDLIA